MLKDYVPSFLASGTVFKSIYEAQQTQIDNVNTDIQDLINQCFVETATWGLDSWEEEFGVSTVLADDYEIRRTRIIAKMRGTGTTTVEMIKNVAESFKNGIVEVIEDNSNYCFTIKFVSKIGIPPNVEDLYSAINQIKPAHLGVNYEFKYTTWGDIYPYTWGEIKDYTWGEILNGALTHKTIPTLYTKLSDDTFSAIKFINE